MRPSRKGGGPRKPPPAAAAPPPAIEMGGRRFVEIGESTVEHDDWFIVRVQQVGLGELVQGQHEAADDFAKRVLTDIIRTGIANELIGALIVPEGKTGLDWTPDMAVETAAFLNQLHKPEDKEVRRGLLCSMLITFFESGLTSLVRSQGSSGTESQPAPDEKGHAPDTESGTPWSGPSPDPTPSTPTG